MLWEFRVRRDTIAIKVKKTKQQTRRRWTLEEDELLIYGVQKWGVGNWSQIRSSMHITGRSNVNLKDRWRTLKNQGRVTD